MTSAIDINTKELWTTEEAAAYAGYSVEHIQDLCKSGAFPYYKRNNRIFIERVDFLAWLREHRVESSDNLSLKAHQHMRSRKAS